MLKIARTKIKGHFLKKIAFVTKKCLAQDVFGECLNTQQYANTYVHKFSYIFCIFYKSILRSEPYQLPICIVHIISPWFNSKIIYVMHLSALKRLTLHFTNPFKSKSYESKFTSYEFKSTSYEFKSTS